MNFLPGPLVPQSSLPQIEYGGRAAFWAMAPCDPIREPPGVEKGCLYGVYPDLPYPPSPGRDHLEMLLQVTHMQADTEPVNKIRVQHFLPPTFPFLLPLPFLPTPPSFLPLLSSFLPLPPPFFLLHPDLSHEQRWPLYAQCSLRTRHRPC